MSTGTMSHTFSTLLITALGMHYVLSTNVLHTLDELAARRAYY